MTTLKNSKPKPIRTGLCIGKLTGIWDTSQYRACWNLTVLGGISHDGAMHRALADKFSRYLASTKSEIVSVVGCETDARWDRSKSFLTQLIGVVLSVSAAYGVRVEILDPGKVRQIAYGVEFDSTDSFDRFLNSAQKTSKNGQFVDGRIAAAYWATVLNAKNKKQGD